MHLLMPLLALCQQLFHEPKQPLIGPTNGILEILAIHAFAPAAGHYRSIQASLIDLLTCYCEVSSVFLRVMVHLSPYVQT